MSLTALFLAGMLWMTGCRQPDPPKPAWVRLDHLTALHPSQSMLVDFDRRLAALERQRQQVLAQSASTPPPTATTQPTPAMSALSASQPSPVLDRQIQQLLDQESAALDRVLRRNWAKQLEDVQLTLDAKATEELEAARAALVNETWQRRLEVQRTFSLPLTNARLALDTARLQAERYPANDLLQYPNTARPLARAQQAYDALLADYRAALEKIQTDFEADVREREREIQAKGHTALSGEDQRLRREYLHLLQQGKTRLDAEYAQGPVEAPLPPMTFLDLPAGQIPLDVPGLRAHDAAADHADLQSRTRATADLDHNIAELRRSRGQLAQEIVADTRDVAVALAAQHGYVLQVDRPSGQEITPSVRTWIAEYWGK